MFRRVLRYVALRPYGSNPLTPAGAFWIFAVRIAILSKGPRSPLHLEKRGVGPTPAFTRDGQPSTRFFRHAEPTCRSKWPASIGTFMNNLA